MPKKNHDLKPLGDTFFPRILASIYSAAVALRNSRFDKHKNLSAELGRAVISVGGISAGGTGKTPMVSAICVVLDKEGMVPVILSRGYGRRFKGVEIVRPGEKAEWLRTGDEPAMLHARHRFIWLAIHPDRRKAAAAVIEKLPANAVFVLDDGFQRRDVRRDLDIVCVHPKVTDDLVIPAGTLREPLDGMRRSDVVCMIGNDFESMLMKKSAAALVEKTQCANPLMLRRKTGPFINLQTKEMREHLDGPVVMLSGIARPERFEQALKDHGVDICDSVIMPDHHSFTQEEIDALIKRNPKIVVTTEKDAVRLSELVLVAPPIFWYLNLEVEFMYAADKVALNESVLKCIGKDIS